MSLEKQRSYETAKRRMMEQGLTPAEYERRVKALAKKHKI